MIEASFRRNASSRDCADDVEYLSRRVYASHALSRFGDRMWEFAVPIMFVTLYKDTLLPAALFNMGIYIAGLIFLPLVGRWVDRTPRLRVVRICIAVDNACTTFVCVLLLLLMNRFDGKTQGTFNLKDAATASLFFSMLILAIMAEMAGKGSTLAIERDWVVVIAGGDKKTLSGINARIRQIDLLCKLLAPIAFGLISQYVKDADGYSRKAIAVGAGVVAGWNVLTAIPEYTFLARVHGACPALQSRDQERDSEPRMSAARQILRGWGCYFRHPVFGASLAYSLLYFTVLDGGTLMTAYLKWYGISPGVLGASRGIGALFGILGTLIFPRLRARWNGNLRPAAAVSLLLFWVTIVPIALVYALNWKYKGAFMLASVVFSRWGLWSFDLGITQLLQENVAKEERATISGCQAGTYQFFYIILSILAIVYSDPSLFYHLVYVSVGIITASVVVFSAWNRRGGGGVGAREDGMRSALLAEPLAPFAAATDAPSSFNGNWDDGHGNDDEEDTDFRGL